MRLKTPFYSVPEDIAVSSSGTIFVANWFYDERARLSIGMYLPPYAQRRLIAKSIRATAVALDRAGNLLVDDQRGIEVYAAPYTAAPEARFAGGDPQLDARGHVFVKKNHFVEMFQTPRYSSPVHTFYVPPYTAKPVKIPKYALGGVNEMSATPAGSLLAWIGESGDNAVYEYVPPYHSRRKQIGSRQGDGRVLVRGDRLFVSDLLGGVKVYASSFDKPPALIANGIDGPVAITVTP